MRNACKSALYTATRRSGVHRLLRRRQRRSLLILAYHSVISDAAFHAGDDAFRNAMSERAFADQLRMACRRYRPVHPDDVATWLAGGPDLPPRAMLVTFDDGMRNNVAYAAPILERLGVPAAFFLATGYVGSDRLLWTDELTWRLERWRRHAVPLPDGGRAPAPVSLAGRRAFARDLRARCKGLDACDLATYLERLRADEPDAELPQAFEVFRFMDWDDARSLARRGFTIGSHSHSHWILSQLSTEALDRELTQSRSLIEAEIGAPCHWIAYPNGRAEDVGEEVRASAARAGYRIGLTTRSGFASRADGAFDLPRITVPANANSTLFDAVTCGMGVRSLR